MVPQSAGTDKSRVCVCVNVCKPTCNMQECNAQLEIVEKGLNQFLDTKKMAFPR